METPASKPRETALSSQDRALALKENPEDTLGQGLLEARSEVRCVLVCFSSAPGLSKESVLGPLLQLSGARTPPFTDFGVCSSFYSTA
uniref:Uncharacterized protein n=1 Tax=Equus asinus asinus TaxID=83772 RepID=A0A8C4PNR9_EQUAS